MDGNATLVEKCKGCKHENQMYCEVYLIPAAKWRTGNCPMATHLTKEVGKKEKINPLKASKREAKKKRGK